MMITVEEALAKVLGYANVLEAENRPLMECLGQVLATDIHSSINIPPLDNSAMDGYAVRSADTRTASAQSPVVLKVIETVAAGSIAKKSVVQGTAARIMTGAPLPVGADAVVRFEDTDENVRLRDAAEIGILSPPVPAGNIRLAGEDVARGARVLAQGTVIKPAHVGVLASLGKATTSVIRRPVVAILATGNELVEIGQPLPPGKIYNSNSYGVAALVQRYGGIPCVLGIAPDREDLLVSSIRRALDKDMLITTGGVSLGDYDVVKDVLAKEGQINFWTVRMKPGKPMAFGTIRGANGKSVPHLGLPGNPVSTMITFELFARPAILKMMGINKYERPIIEAEIDDHVENEDRRRVYARVIVSRRNGRYYARTTGPQGSAILTSMSLANGLAIIPEDNPGVNPGDNVQVLMIDWSGGEF